GPAHRQRGVAVAAFGANLAAQLEDRAAARRAQLRVPAAFGLLGIEGERGAAFEARGGGPDRAADHLAPAALGLHPEPAVERSRPQQGASPAAKEIEPDGDTGVAGEPVAAPLIDDEVERIAAAAFAVAVLVKLDVVEAHRRADKGVAAAQLVGRAAAERRQRAHPLALDVLGHGLAIFVDAEECTLAGEIDPAERTAREQVEPAPTD